MRKIRVLIVDDSVVVRKLLTDVLSADPALEVAGTAANGRIALAKLPQVSPDLVTLDVEMPEMDGLETLATLRSTYPHLPVIMVSSLTQRGAAATLDALALGATDYVTKPAHVGSMVAGLQRIGEELIPKIKTFCASIPEAGIRLGPAIEAKDRRPPLSSRLLTSDSRPRIDIVAIGVSTGGPNALATLFPQWPARFPVPIVLVQHMPATFTKLLAERLAAKSEIQVHEGTPGQTLRPGHAWIAPGDSHMILERSASTVRLQMHQGPPENSCRPAVDVLFRSVAQTYGPHALAVVLTGMGQDGLRGCEAIREAGGQVLVQDEASSVVWGMPGIVAKAGLADQVLPLDQLGNEILRRVEESRGTQAIR
jgi:two-component system chemotaxis response regulator CheB